MGTCALPDMYVCSQACSPWASGIRSFLAKHLCPCYNYYSTCPCYNYTIKTRRLFNFFNELFMLYGGGHTHTCRHSLKSDFKKLGVQPLGLKTFEYKIYRVCICIFTTMAKDHDLIAIDGHGSVACVFKAIVNFFGLS